MIRILVALALCVFFGSAAIAGNPMSPKSSSGGSPISPSVASGIGKPGGSSGQIQYNKAGVLGGLTSFYVEAYGAVCDGAIFNGVQTTNSSPNISLITSGTTTNQYTDYRFSQADVGKIITINRGQFNTPHPTSTDYFSSTILSVTDGTHAVLSDNANFTSSSYSYATARMYKTDNHDAIQAALDAGFANGGGNIVFPSGTCATSGPLTFYSNQTISGQGPSTTWVMLTNGSNSDLFKGQNFEALKNTNNSGLSSFVFQNIGLDGNKFANTGSGAGTETGTGDGIRVYGSNFYTHHVYIQNFAADGWFSQWNDGAGDSLNSNVSLNSHLEELSISNNNGYGLVYDGPHDGLIDTVDMINNTLGGFRQYGYHQLGAHTNGGPVKISNVHTYQNGGEFFGGAVSCTSCVLEDETHLLGFSYNFADSNLGTLTLGDSTHTSIYKISMSNTEVSTLNNSGAYGTGYIDNWTGGTVTSVSGSYNPDSVFGTYGLINGKKGYGQGTGGGQLRLGSGASWDAVLTQSSSNVFSIYNGGHNVALFDLNGRVAFGNAVSATNSGASLYIAGTDSILLPVGTTGQRPGTPVDGMLRYNSTTNVLEAYIASAWNQILTSTSGVLDISKGGSGGDGAVNAQTTNYTLALTDVGRMVELNSASAITATVPPNANVAFAIGSQINVMQYGAGEASIVAGSGVTIRHLSTLTLSARYGVVTLVKIGTDEWVAAGAFN